MAVGLGLLAGLLFVVHRLVVPPVVRSRVTAALRELGFESPRFEVLQASLWGTELRNISGEGLAVGSASIDYGPRELLSGRIDTITLRGAEIDAALRDGQLDLGPFSNQGTGGGGDLPFNRLLVHASTLHLDWEGQDWRLPIEATLTNLGSGRLHLTADTFAAGSGVSIEATHDRPGDDLLVEVTAPQVNVASLLAAVPPSVAGDAIRAGGQMGVALTYRSRSGSASTDVQVDPAGLWVETTLGGRGVVADGIEAHIETTLNADWQPVRLVAAGDLGTVGVEGIATAQEVQIQVETIGQTLSFSASGAAEDWRLVRLDGEVEGLLASAEAPSTAPSAEPSAALIARADYQLTGRLPGWVVDELKTHGVDASGVAEGEVKGDAELFFNPTPVDGRQRWGLETEATRIALPGGEITFHNDVAKLRRLDGVLLFSGSVGPREATMRLLDDSWLSVQSIEAGAGEQAITATDAEFALLPQQDAPALRILFGEDNSRLTAAARLRSATPLNVNAAGNAIQASLLEVEANLDSGAGKATSVGAVVCIEGASATLGETVLEKIAAEVPITWNRPTGEGRFSIGSIVRDGHPLPGISGTINIAQGAAAFTADWTPLQGADVTLAGRVAPGDAGWAGQVDAELKPFTLTDETALAALIPALEGMAITGGFGGRASVKLDRGRIEPRVELTVKNAKLENAARDLAADAINGELVINSFDPFSTASAQRLTIGRLSKGELVLTKGLLDFEVESPDSILVEQTQWNWAGGRLYSHAFRFNPAEANIDIVLYADGIRLEELLELTAKDRVEGEGTLYGRLPVSIRWPTVEFGDGFLYSLPGAVGQLKFADAEMASAMLEQADPRFKGDPNFAQVRQRVIDALRDFQYDELRVDLENEKDGTLLARINLHGQGRIGDKPQELYLTWNIRGLEELLNEYLRLQERLSID